MKFRPEEIFFSPASYCNLNCAHCGIEKQTVALSKRSAEKFLIDCKKHCINRVGFTGGEPFLALDFLCALSQRAVREDMLFGRIMTNGVWFRKKGHLQKSLKRLRASGYDGEICVSVDAFHKQDLKKLAVFIKASSDIWDRKDIITIACVTGAKEKPTEEKLVKLSRLLKARFAGLSKEYPVIKNGSLFIRIFKIVLSPIGEAGRLKSPWDGRWFKEDYCKGPGNVFFVMPDGTVKPCCGYANENEALTIGNIHTDSSARLMKNLEKNRFVYTIFNSGLSSIRNRIEDAGFTFPGKTQDHCFFCNYLLTGVPRELLDKCLD